VFAFASPDRHRTVDHAATPHHVYDDVVAGQRVSVV
jgi:hypothetical protein